MKTALIYMPYTLINILFRIEQPWATTFNVYLKSFKFVMLRSFCKI